MVIILTMSAKLANLDLLKIKVFWNKGYIAITSFHDVTNKIISCDSNNIVDVVMWPKFGNSSISMREVINVIRIWSGKLLFWGDEVVLVQVQSKSQSQSKSQKVFGVNSYVCRNYRGKLVWGLSAPLPE